MLSPEERKTRIEQIRNFPAEIEALIAPLSDEDLHLRLAPEEWSILQIIHHLPDAHMNGFVRIKNVLTQDYPNLVGYDQDKWSNTADVVATPIEASFTILRGLHQRLVLMFEYARSSDWSRMGRHSDGFDMTLDDLLVQYSNHGQEHIQQIQEILEKKKA